jgi:hypothetical protein
MKLIWQYKDWLAVRKYQMSVRFQVIGIWWFVILVIVVK